MKTSLDIKRIAIYLAFAFGIAWAAALVIFLTGGLANSPKIAGNYVSLALILEVSIYMTAPAIANLLTRWVTHEPWQGMLLRPRLRKGWLFWLAGWFGPAFLTLLGAAIFFLVFPQHFDRNLTTLQNIIQQGVASSGLKPPQMSLWAVVGLQTLQAIFIAPLINGIPTFGEEFGWRGYLQPRLMPLGERKAMLWMGIIWGVWHAPLILMGHNYGLTYPGATWLGAVVMLWFTFVAGTFIGWASLRADSVWPAVIGHAAINGIAGIASFAVQGNPNPLLGPLPIGLVGSAGFAIATLLIFVIPGALKPAFQADAAIVPKTQADAG